MLQAWDSYENETEKRECWAPGCSVCSPISTEKSATTMAESPVAVSAKVEETLRKHLLARARERCAPIIEDFSKCTDGRTISVVWKCRTQFNEMNECLHR